MTNEQRAEQLIREYGFAFDNLPREKIRDLLQKELTDFQSGSSEYVRLLCGYLYCVGDSSDIPLLEKVKYGINFDVECMIDAEWIESLRNGGVEGKNIHSRKKIMEDFVTYYANFEAEDEW